MAYIRRSDKRLKCNQGTHLFKWAYPLPGLDPRTGVKRRQTAPCNSGYASESPESQSVGRSRGEEPPAVEAVASE